MDWNREQLAVINHRGDAFRVFGGPGSGKTRLAAALACDSARNQGMGEETIIVVKSSAGAAAMEEEIYRLTGENPVRITTFAGLARQITLKASRTVSGFQIRALLADILANLPGIPLLKRAAWSEQLATEIGGLLNLLRVNLVTPDKLPSGRDNPLLKEMKTVYAALEQRIAGAGLITEPELMREASISARIKCRALIVEDAQDITPAEYRLLYSLSQGGKAKFALFGDIYRNIHRFEGTDPDLLRRRVETDFTSGLATVYLKSSYTLGSGRIEAARSIFGLEAKPHLPIDGLHSGERLFYSEFDSAFDEAVAVSCAVEELIRHRGITPEKIAVVLRSPSVDGPRFRRALKLKGIPVNGGTSPFLPPPVRDLLNRIAELDAAAEIPDSIRKTALQTAAGEADEDSLQALAFAAGMAAEAAAVLPRKSPAEIAELVKVEFINSNPSRQTGGVSITSVHAAKGRSFEAVFLPALLENGFPSEVNRWFIFTPGWMENLRSRVEGLLSYIERADLERHLNEERRLFYTALCLPAPEIYLSRPLSVRGEPVNPSLFLFETGILPTEKNHLTKPWPSLIHTPLPLEDALMAERARLAVKPDAERILGSAADSGIPPQTDLAVEAKGIPHISAGAVNTYLFCPRKFYYQHHLRLPIPYTPAMLSGKTLHQALEEIHSERGRLDPDSARENLDAVLSKVIAAAPEIEADSAEAAVMERYLRARLEEYLSDSDFYGGNVLKLEEIFEWEPEPGLKFIGRIDRIDETSGGVELIDYKKRGKHMHKALHSRFCDIGHQEADLQLPIYFFAAEEALSLKVERFTLLPLDFKDSGPRRISFTVSAEEVKSVDSISKNRLGEIREEFMSLARAILQTAEFGRGPHTRCRDVYSGVVCPFIQICEIAE